MYLNTETEEQKTYKLAAIDFVHKAAQRARARQAFREEQQWATGSYPVIASE